MANVDDRGNMQPNTGKKKKVATKKKAVPRKKVAAKKVRTKKAIATKKKTTVVAMDAPASEPTPSKPTFQDPEPGTLPAPEVPAAPAADSTTEKGVEEAKEHKKEEVTAKMEDMGLIPKDDTDNSSSSSKPETAAISKKSGKKVSSAVYWLGLLVFIGAMVFWWFEEFGQSDSPISGEVEDRPRPLEVPKAPLSEPPEVSDLPILPPVMDQEIPEFQEIAEGDTAADRTAEIGPKTSAGTTSAGTKGSQSAPLTAVPDSGETAPESVETGDIQAPPDVDRTLPATQEPGSETVDREESDSVTDPVTQAEKLPAQTATEEQADRGTSDTSTPAMKHPRQQSHPHYYPGYYPPPYYGQPVR
uniref:Uncharacterized protein n=1 Tax=Candidatus Kentrum sp. FM TaxID=2126340 RepID=A0A450S081_9GAMM|nr:MAG: hypothetical protein BECKFM1743C_GA0114222_1002110 [Candidatus Kentron sp. FM]VFJ69283.1 MAG: hypothetical protein BECKFM1743A_GA0114220_105045 [Candidatus Kentron sp. FM]VFK10076.1 MAG: hypothetical protein BECKFM1743B_GA0114221_101289 [Candidatus Kentron sp. FM]